MLDDTIAAIATPLGEGGLAVVRLSGPGAFAIADQCFLPVGKTSLKPSAAPTHTIQFGRIVRGDRVIDEVLLAILRSPPPMNSSPANCPNASTPCAMR